MFFNRNRRNRTVAPRELSAREAAREAANATRTQPRSARATSYDDRAVRYFASLTGN